VQAVLDEMAARALDDARGDAVQLHPGKSPVVTDGPFPEVKEVLGG
jgi:hypothetical protein